MGMFDTFHGEVICPHCNTRFKVEEQTKNYDCLLNDMYIGDYVAAPSYIHPAYGEPKRSYYYKFEAECPHCHKTHNYAIAIKDLQIVAFLRDEDATEDELNGLNNVKPHLYRYIKWELNKAALQGVDEFPDSQLLDKGFIDNIAIGDTVKVFDTDFKVNRVLVADIDETKKMSGLEKIWYGKRIFLEVYKDTLKRLLILDLNGYNMPELVYTFNKIELKEKGKSNNNAKN